MPRRTTGALLALVLVATAACGGGGKDEAKDTTTTRPAPTTSTTAPPLAPLTGLPATDADTLARPALVVKIDNVEPKSRPQAGVNAADVVFEERVEGSVTRLLAIFHSTDTSPVGPVRSARTSDLGVLNALHVPYFAWSGANDFFKKRIREAPLTDVGYDAASSHYKRDPKRRAPDNLMLLSSAELRNLPAADGAAPPPPFFQYRAPGQVPAHLQPVTQVHVTYGSSAGSAPVDYAWNGTGWARSQSGTPHVDADGLQVAPANVIIQFVDYISSGVNDQFGKPIPEAQLVGTGSCWVLTAGGLIEGTWSKPTLQDVTSYKDVDGNPITLTPGRTWVALPNPGGATHP
jgi:hypothetical protein